MSCNGRHTDTSNFGGHQTDRHTDNQQLNKHTKKKIKKVGKINT